MPISLKRVTFLLSALALLGAVGTAWYAARTGRTEREMRAFLRGYALFQEARRTNHARFAERLSGEIPIPVGLEVLVLYGTETSHAAVARPRLAIPRLYCALWTGAPPDSVGPPEPDEVTARHEARCGDPSLFEAWIARSRAFSSAR